MTLSADPVVSRGDPGSRKRGVGIKVQQLVRKFADRTVLDGLDLSVDPGAFVAVVGRSGCGKSTLLRLAAGLDAPDAGRLAFEGGERPGDVARVMFQEPRLLPWASVIANVELGLGALRSTPEGRAQALKALEAVGLSGRANDWPSILSGGQRQRVALARALVSRPRFLALDEPLGALDALTRIEMQRLIEAIWLRERFTAVLVTHDVAEAIALTDRIVLLENGRISRDIAVELPRPRQRGSDAFGALEEGILNHLIGASEGRREPRH